MNQSTTKPALGSWIKAFRLRTLPLALSCTVTGSFMAVASGRWNGTVIALTALTTLLLQILSNLANDYGDGIKGTDNQQRIGPERTIQSGEISVDAMKRMIILVALLSFISGIFLLFFSLKNHWITAIVFLVLGIAAILAAVKYTVGVKAYGYYKLGDLFVFLFFGLTGVMGSYYLNTLTLSWDSILPAITIGLFSTGVLNLNNMRDIDNDAASKKKTIASALGLQKAKYYHLFLIGTGWVAAIVFVLLHYRSVYNFLFVLTLPLFAKDLTGILKTTDNALLDPFLKKLALSTFLFSVLFGVGLLL